MSSQNVTVLALVGIPVLAALCMGMLVRSLADRGKSWGLWLLVLAALCATWLYIFSGPTAPPV